MIWTLDTSKRGHAGCEAAELTKVLEEAMEHHGKTAVEGARNAVFAALGTDDKHNPDRMAAAAIFADEKKGEAAARLPKVQEQMREAIAAAQALANFLGGRVTCSLSGHRTPDHAHGIFQRISVSVDRAVEIDGD